MSTLTKILVVLLTISSIFLCGIVVTYVANADNFREKYNDLRADRDALSQKVKNLNDQLSEKTQQKDELENQLNNEIASLKTKTGELQTKLANAEREKAQLIEKVNSWVSVVESFSATAEDKQLLLKKTLEELQELETEQIKQGKQLDEAMAALIERQAIIEALGAEKKRLVEEKTDLQSRLDQLLQSRGKVAAAVEPVTPMPAVARPAAQVQIPAGEIGLKGLVSEVNMQNFLAGISIGSADGVREGMRFHVTRGDEFVCDILIIDVDTEKAVGVLELVQKQPRVGDTVSTNL